MHPSGMSKIAVPPVTPAGISIFTRWTDDHFPFVGKELMFPSVLSKTIYVTLVNVHKIPLVFAFLDDFVCHAVQAVVHFSH